MQSEAAATGKKGKKQSAEKSVDESKLFIGGLPTTVKEAEIRQVFSQVGAVKEVHIMAGRSQSGQACAFVVYPDVYSAQLAIRTLNKTPWHSAPEAAPIIVRIADKANPRKGRGKKDVAGDE
jgi:RNA recognition motif-containing protein